MTIKLKDNTPEPGRNEACVCGSGLKYKRCHGDPCKLAICNRIVDEHMTGLIMKEKLDRGLITKREHNAFLAKRRPDALREPVTQKDINKLLDSAGLKRCACGIPIPDNCEMCVKCKRLKG